MAAMLVVLRFLLVFVTTMKSRADSAKTIEVSAQGGETVLLSTDQLRGGVAPGWDVRWTHPHLVASLKGNTTLCRHGRCELLSDGSLRFSSVQTEDAGRYSLQVFDERGMRLTRTNFLLRVEDQQQTVKAPSLIFLLLLLLLVPFFIGLFILRKRRIQRATAACPVEENEYATMCSHHGNKSNDDRENPERQQEFVNADISVETEDVYV